ncbi:nitrous oxide reductase accessory protein NosL [Thiobacillus sp.]|uniref:nitrous oxide reductase accessory protein NosL n=1 Tax=Thiobacillus sp. TaxID=924 RepID=UPI0011DB5DA8|nr:nitrous oxide reductase accessory protein NosL [Thiobacillus sp.]MBD3812374.1 nitrous oxide reductase accessory protein NosL [Betaproteobacteria bacterium]TXH76683.1 MAG: nitrous oxide reductase accessory protein NosL [Thiobacillus sp.]
MTSIRRTLILASLTATLLAACGQSTGPGAVAPLEITRDTSCSLDGMLLADYPGPKAQIFYAGQAEPDFFCDTIEMFHVYLTPEQVREVRGIFVQDMGKAAWDEPHGHWIDAKSAYYVYGSKREGSMGPTIASFALEQDATKFAAEYGGKVYHFADIQPDMVVLDGGVLNDSHM